jgi:methionyl-tRNA synthetase
MKITKHYITTPIFYPNDKPHLGHAYTIVIADIIARYKRNLGKDHEVFLQTGTDEHGEKIAKKAKELKITPQELVDRNVKVFQQLFSKLNISKHFFYRTTNPFHIAKVEEI